MDYDQILPPLFVGACPRRPRDIDQLKEDSGITAVLNLQTVGDFSYWGIDWSELELHYQRSGIEVRRVPVTDFDRDDLRRNLPKCVRTLDELLRGGHTAYVHCSAGINRSPSTVIAYLHWIEQFELDKAITHVMQRRPCDPYLEAIRAATEDWQER